MAAESVGSLVVTRKDVLAGMVTRRDLIAAQLLSDEIYRSQTLEDIMVSPVLTISHNHDVGQAID